MEVMNDEWWVKSQKYKMSYAFRGREKVFPANEMLSHDVPVN